MMEKGVSISRSDRWYTFRLPRWVCNIAQGQAKSYPGTPEFTYMPSRAQSMIHRRSGLHPGRQSHSIVQKYFDGRFPKQVQRLS